MYTIDGHRHQGADAASTGISASDISVRYRTGSPYDALAFRHQGQSDIAGYRIIRHFLALVNTKTKKQLSLTLNTSAFCFEH
jgi:hypothetical protein